MSEYLNSPTDEGWRKISEDIRREMAEAKANGYRQEDFDWSGVDPNWVGPHPDWYKAEKQ